MALTIFPTPYPDETIYSVICRLRLRLGQPSYYSLGQKLIGGHLSLTTPMPYGIGRLASHLPEKSELTAEYLINKTTLFPYFAPFLPDGRKSAFLEYMSGKTISKNYAVAGFDMGNIRQPKHLHLKLCESCWREQVQTYDEPYWQRIRQLPGILICPHHEEPLKDSPVLISLANLDFYAASIAMLKESNVCGHFVGNVAQNLLLLSENSL
jgi:hypothetical protein